MSDLLKSLQKPGLLVVIHPGGEPELFPLEQKQSIGRQGLFHFKSDNKIALNYSILAANQGMISHYLGEWHYKNLASSNETFFNAQTLQPDQDVILKNGDTLKIVRNQDLLMMIFMENKAEDMEWKQLPLDPTQEVYHIYSHVGNQEQDEIRTEVDNSHHHALLRYVNNAWQVEDINTDRGVYVNQIKIDRAAVLHPYDIVTIGNTLFVFTGEYLAYNHTSFRFNDLQIHIEERSIGNFFNKHTLLKDIELTIEPGNLVLILGGSGAGKTTFINAVTGYEKAKANIRQGDLDVYEDYSKIKYQIGMVPQQDLLRGEDTVGMTLMNAAEMRMPEDTSNIAREKRVREVLSLFGLDTVKDELVEKLSGGQRKRLSIAVEFVADPSLFILDEPDSGLDGVMARDLMQELRKIADQGKIVLVITHTPDRVVDLFDKVIVLAKNSSRTGQLAFYGTIPEAKNFFNRDSMEKIVLAVNGKNEGGEGLADQYIAKYASWKKKNVVRKSKEINSRIQYTGRLRQTRIYLGKLFRIFIFERDWKVLPMSAAVSLMVSYVLGIYMFANMERLQASAFAMVCVCIWNGFFNSIQVVCRERPIIKREHRAGLHISAYIFAHMLYQTFICLLQVMISIAVYKAYGIRFPSTGPITGYFMLDLGIVLFIITYTADMMALMISCIVRSTTAAMTVMPFLLIIQLVFAGVIFPMDTGISANISKCTVSRWGTNAICSVADYNALPSQALFKILWEYRSIPEIKKLVDYIQSSDLRQKLDALSGEQQKKPEYNTEHLPEYLAILSAFGLLYAGIGIISLEFIDRDKR